MKPWRLLPCALLCLALVACGGGGGGNDDPPDPVDPGEDVVVSGTAEKGPYTVGAVITVTELAADGTRTEIGTREVRDVLGEFDLAFDAGSVLELSITGFYRNELDGLVSAAEQTLVAVVHLSQQPDQRAHINVLTHLASARAAQRFQNGEEADAAIANAEQDVLTALAPLIAPPAIEGFHLLNIVGSDGAPDGNGYLLALSALFYQYAVDHAVAGDVDGALAALLAGLREDLADGALDDASVLDDLRASIPNVPPERVASVLDTMAQAGEDKLEYADINAFIDSDLDGAFNVDDADDDGDGVGDTEDIYPYDPRESADFDGDGLGDNADRDDDDDGVNDDADPFPQDAGESRDTDDDGVGDNADGDDDGDGVADAEDAFPVDGRCFRAEDGADGACDIEATIPAAYTAAATVVDDGGVVYLLDAQAKRVYRWSAADGEYLYSLHLEGDGAPAAIAYSPAHLRLYVGYESGALTRFDLTAKPVLEQDFATAAGAVEGLAATGQFLVAQTGIVPATHTVYDAAAVLIDEAPAHDSGALGWSPVTRRLYFLSEESSPVGLHYEVIDTAGVIGAGDEVNNPGNYALAPPIRVSVTGDRVLAGSGDVFTADLVVAPQEAIAPVADAQWLADGGLVTLRADGDGSVVERTDAAGAPVGDPQTFDGAPVALLPAGGGFVVVTARDRPQFGFFAAAD
jgi:hypothetical protein